MKTLTLTRLTLLIHISCFLYFLFIIFSDLINIESESLLHLQFLSALILGLPLYFDLSFLLYMLYSSSIFILSCAIFSFSKGRFLIPAIAVLVSGFIWSGFLLLNGSIAIGLIQPAAKQPPLHLNHEEIWQTFNIMLRVAARGSEMIGAIWVLLVALLLPSNHVSLKVTKLITSLIVVISACAYFERSELFSSLFDSLLILWFLCMYFSFPYAYKYWKSNS
ncbi:MAG: hypothetical protein ACPGUE_07170 [Marinomonas sp.]